jgi:hypothetical protein
LNPRVEKCYIETHHTDLQDRQDNAPAYTNVVALTTNEAVSIQTIQDTTIQAVVTMENHCRKILGCFPDGKIKHTGQSCLRVSPYTSAIRSQFYALMLTVKTDKVADE